MSREDMSAKGSIAQQISNLTKANQQLQYKINERIQVEAEMQSAIEKFQTIADRAPAYIALINAQTLIYEFVNSVFADAYGLKRENIIGHHMKEIIGEEYFQFAQKYITGVKTGKTVFYENYFITAIKKGWLHVNYSPVHDGNGQVVSFVVLSWDITSQKLTDEKIKNLLVEKDNILMELEKLAITDPLTGAYNRRYFCEVGTRELARARRTNQVLSIIMFDLDHFKEINDTMGHSIGDKVLKAVVTKIQSTIRANDTFSRLGGEEFFILLPDTNGQAALLAAERFRTLIANIDTVQNNNEILRFAASFGVYQVDPAIADFELVFQKVDSALYMAKAKGRNCAVLLQ